MDDIPDGEMWSGAPARPQREWLQGDVGVLQARGPACARSSGSCGERDASREGAPTFDRRLRSRCRASGCISGASARSPFIRRRRRSGIIFRRTDLPGDAHGARARGARRAHGAPHAARRRSRRRCTPWSTCSRRWPGSRSTTSRSTSTPPSRQFWTAARARFIEALLTRGRWSTWRRGRVPRRCARRSRCAMASSRTRVQPSAVARRSRSSIDFPHPLIGRQSCRFRVTPRPSRRIWRARVPLASFVRPMRCARRG